MRGEEASVPSFGHEYLFTHLNEHMFSWFTPLFTRIEASTLETVEPHFAEQNPRRHGNPKQHTYPAQRALTAHHTDA